MTRTGPIASVAPYPAEERLQALVAAIAASACATTLAANEIKRAAQSGQAQPRRLAEFISGMGLESSFPPS